MPNCWRVRVVAMTGAAVVLGLAAMTLPAMAAGEDLSARGVVRAQAEAAIATELVAVVRKVPFRDGQSFVKGDLLIGFDCARYAAELKAAEAAYRAESVTAVNNRRLLKHQAIGRNELAVSEARASKAQAEAAAIRSRLVNCEIKAPFSGRVVERVINEHEMPKAGELLMRIVASGPMEVDIIVPSLWMTWLATGTAFEFTVDETGELLNAQVSRIGAAVDPVSKTVKIIGSFAGKDHKVLPGMSGSATFARPGS